MVKEKTKMVIVFSGLDCSGKSTQIESLNAFFLNQKRKSYLFWSRGGYTPNIQKGKDFLRFLFRSKLPSAGNSEKRARLLYRSGYIKKIWINLAILDLVFFYSIFLRFKCLLGYNIICDRFWYDTKLDFEIAFPDVSLNKMILWKLLIKTAIKWDKYYVSVVPVPVAVERSKFKFEPFPDKPEILEIRLKRYLDFCDLNPQIILIDGTQDKNIISSMIQFDISK